MAITARNPNTWDPRGPPKKPVARSACTNARGIACAPRACPAWWSMLGLYAEGDGSTEKAVFAKLKQHVFLKLGSNMIRTNNNYDKLGSNIIPNQ